jgi:hypothetical protein
VSSEDEKLVQAMSYEYRLLSQSYREFLFLLSKNKGNHNDEIKLHLYNSYAKILHHLYEFLKSCVAREFSKTKSNNPEIVKKYIAGELGKIASQRGEEQYLQSDFEQFAEDLRMFRNKVYGHVFKERFDQYPLGDFYSNNHAYVAWLIHSTENWWATEAETLARHESVQSFSELLTFGQGEC